MKAHPIRHGTNARCLCHDRPAAYSVDFGGNRLFDICGECYAAVFGRPVPDALLRLSQRSTTNEARETFRAWMEHLGAVEAAKRLGGSFT